MESTAAQTQNLIRKAIMLLSAELAERVVAPDFKAETLSFYTAALSNLDSAIRYVDQCESDAFKTD